ncbi:MAG: AraC family transcriptional regulator [Bradyrhizobium sp.]|nr:AraC family transcriptional regulator [Bradyrhizobium sp.]
MSGEGGRQNGGAPACRLPPDFDKHIYSAQLIAALVAELSGQGIRPSLGLAGSGLSEGQLEAHTTRISYRQIDLVLRNTLRLSKDPAVALRAGQRMRVTTHGMYGYALLSSATHAEARDFANRYLRVVGPLCDARYSYEGATVVCGFEPLHWPNPTEEVHRFAAEFALSAHLTTMKDIAGEAFRFSRISLACREPGHVRVYQSIFECPVLFSQPTNEYRFELAQADGPIALADSRTHGMAREMCEQILSEVNNVGGLASDIRRILVEQPGRYPSIEALAERLAMHPRALRRKLEAEDTSYRELLADVRARLAIEYLRRTAMTNEEIAARLGYSDAANFRHAFVRWTGKSPSDFRVSTSIS